MKCTFVVDVLVENKISNRKYVKKNISVEVEHPSKTKCGCVTKIHNKLHKYETKYTMYRGFEWTDDEKDEF
jgi:hypothetical protein